MLSKKKEEFDNFQLCMYISNKQNNTKILPREIMLHIWKYMSKVPLMQQGGIQVLIAGGIQNNLKSNKTYIFNSKTNLWSEGVNLTDNLYDNEMTILNDKSILSVGGCDFDYLNITKILFNDKWTSVAELHVPRTNHCITTLHDGKVVVVGGIDNIFAICTSVEIYDPKDKKWSIYPSVTKNRNRSACCTLPDGRVLIVGGINKYGNCPTCSCEYFDPKTNSCSPAPDTLIARADHRATILQDGRVLVTGGQHGYCINTLNNVEIFDPKTEIWTLGTPMRYTREEHTATLLSDGRVLVVGGIIISARGNRGNSKNCEFYTPDQDGGKWSSAPNFPCYIKCHSAAFF